jgi:hypothetical protein
MKTRVVVCSAAPVPKRKTVLAYNCFQTKHLLKLVLAPQIVVRGPVDLALCLHFPAVVISAICQA